MASRVVKRVYILVSGIVQGVFFRHHTKELAEKLGFVGWARNTKDGGVEVVAESSASSDQEAKEKLEELVKWCRQGPPAAQVEKVEIEWQEATGEFQGFEIKY